MSKTTTSYYGPFFWVATISFLVPIAVAARAFHEVQLTTKPTPHPDASGVDHALWDYLLKTYVDRGLVDYDGLSRDHLFRTYLRQLSEAAPENLTTAADELALLCNAYNAFVINGVVTHKIAGSVMDYRHNGREFFDVEEHIFNGQTISLNYLEHELIRKRFKEPRVHVALVCAARSCPSIRSEAYVGRRIAEQLEDQSLQFANDSKFIAFDAGSNTLYLSPILKWYGQDWDAVGGYLDWLARRAKSETVTAALERAAQGEVRVVFTDYDWSLNSQSTIQSRPNAPPKKTANFGSGTIPNR